MYCYTKIKIFGLNLAVIKEESVSDMFIFQVNHLNPSLAGHWKTGGVGPKVPSETISSIQASAISVRTELYHGSIHLINSIIVVVS